MAAQPIYPDDLKYELDRLFTRMTAYMDGQRDAVMTQMRVDKQELKAEIGQLRQETNERFSKLENTQSDIVVTLQTLMTTFNTTTQAIVKQMQDNHAEAMEAINDVKVRVTKLEEKDK